MLDGLRLRTVVHGHDQHRRIDLAGPDEHVADQPVVARHVDEVQLRATRQGHVRVADVDGHASSPLLGQAIGVDAGQRAEEGRLAVVDVAGGADDDGHAGAWYGPGCAP